MPEITLTKENPLKAAKLEFDTLLKNSHAIQLLRINVILLGLSWILFGIFFQFLPPQIPLLFSRPWGSGQLIPKKELILLPIVLTLCLIINARLASITIGKDKLLASMFLWGQMIISLLAGITLSKIILLLA